MIRAVTRYMPGLGVLDGISLFNLMDKLLRKEELIDLWGNPETHQTEYYVFALNCFFPPSQ